MTVKFCILRKGAEPPVYATPGCAACDLKALLDAPVIIKPNERVLIPTGLAIALPSPEYVALICARSGMAYKRGLALANGIGVIDSDYRGELLVALINNSGVDQTIESGDRIAQLMIVPAIQAVFTESASLDETERGEGGFGSTGTK